MKRQFFLTILTTAVFLVSMVADNVASAQLPKRGLIESKEEFSASLEPVLSPDQIQQMQNYFWAPLWQVEMEAQYFNLVFQGIRLIPVEEQFARAEISYYVQVLRKLVNRAEIEDRTLTDAEAQAIEDEFFANLSKGLRFDQMQQAQNNLARNIDAVSHWQDEIQQQYFDLVFEGIELTPREEQFARTELSRSNQAWNRFVDRAEAEGRGLTDTDAQSSKDEFLASLEKGLRPDQIQQVQNNLIHTWF